MFTVDFKLKDAETDNTMRYVVGVHTVIKTDDLFAAIAVAWRSNISDIENRARVSSQELSRLVLVQAVTYHSDERDAINSALIRLSEKLYIRGLVANPVHGDPSLHVVTRPKQRNTRLAYPHTVDGETIAVRGASRLLKEHLDG